MSLIGRIHKDDENQWSTLINIIDETSEKTIKVVDPREFPSKIKDEKKGEETFPV